MTIVIPISDIDRVHIKGLSPNVELLKFKRDDNNIEWYNVEMAIDNIPCMPFDVPIDVIRSFANEEALCAYLERQAQGMLAAYGDRRSPNLDAFAEYMRT